MMNELMSETILIGSVGLLWVVVLFNLLLTLALVRRATSQCQHPVATGDEPRRTASRRTRLPTSLPQTLDGEAVSSRQLTPGETFVFPLHVARDVSLAVSWCQRL